MNTPPADEKDAGIRILGGLALSIVVWLVAFTAATVVLARDTASAATRAAAVAVAVGATRRTSRRSDA